MRCAAYLDVARFEKERVDIDQAWPAYAADPTLSRLPHFFWHDVLATGAGLTSQHAERLQLALSCMSHHIHPRVDPSSYERRSIESCRPKSAKGDMHRRPSLLQERRSSGQRAHGSGALNMRVYH